MSFFSRLRRNSTAVDRYTSRSSSYGYSGSDRPRHKRHERPIYDAGAYAPHAISVESIPYLPSENAHGGASSEVSLRSEYTHLDHDTNRYPKWSTPTSSIPSTTHKPRADTPVHESPNSTFEFSGIRLIFNLPYSRHVDGGEPGGSHARCPDLVHCVECS